MATNNFHTLFGDEPAGPLCDAQAILSFMSAAWMAEDQALGKSTADSPRSEFACLRPRVHASMLDIVENLIGLSKLMMKQEAR